MMLIGRLVRKFSGILALALVATVVIPDLASARTIERRHYGVWTYRYYIAPTFASCDVRTTWPGESKVLMLRLKRKRIEFYFYNRDWNLTPRRRYRDAEFDFGSRRFWTSTQTIKSRRALYGFFRGSTSDFLRRFVRAYRMRLYLPTGESFNVNLRGSSAAMNAAIRCWRRNLR